MSKKEKLKFVRDLTRTIRDRILDDITGERVPKDWNGIELRQLLADKFSQSTFKMSRPYMAKYKNDVLIYNL